MLAHGAQTRLIAKQFDRIASHRFNVANICEESSYSMFDHFRNAGDRRRSPLPLVSIVEATCAAARAQGLRRLGLFGTRFTMQGRFYPDVFTRSGIELVVPAAAEQEYIHEKYMSELVLGVVLPETRARLLEVVDRLRRQENIDGLILGGTELPLILRDAREAGVPLLDTTRIHVEAIVGRMLE